MYSPRMITHTTHAYTHARALRHTHTKKEIETERERRKKDPLKMSKLTFRNLFRTFSET